MPSYSVNQLFTSLADAGRELLRGRLQNRSRSLPDQADELLSTRGDASSAALARELLDSYAAADPAAKTAFFQHLAERFGIDRPALEEAIAAYQAAPDGRAVCRLRRVLETPRHELFRRLNTAPDGTRRLLDMRAELLRQLAHETALRPVDDDLETLLAGWFNPGFLTLKPIDWDSPASLLEKLLRYERVHKIPNLEALRRRLAADRRCFAFFHPALPHEPLIFVQVALVKGMADAVQPILDLATPLLPAAEADTAIFYSISNCQPGLKGVSLGNFLIKMVMASLQAELPHLKTFSTLSPIPGFTAWLESGAMNAEPAIAAEATAALRALERDDWHLEPVAAAELKPRLLSLCAHYLVRVKRGQQPLDPVARFHLGNGASLERLNWLGDISKKGMAESAGLLVNYRYDESKVAANHEAYAASGEVITAPAVRSLLPAIPAEV